MRKGSHFLYQNTILLYYKENSVDVTRIGISVSKKVGKANIRNKYKRIIREHFRVSEFKNLSKDILVVLNAKKYKHLYCSNSNFSNLLRDDLHNSFKNIAQQ